MKLFIVDRGSSPGDVECQVVIANSVDDARVIADKAMGDMWKPRILSIQKVRQEEGVVYTGYNCC